ncbi:hypothetical protein PAPHI01_0378 [Pancytospora philotis]|nr:hypothetical protein PAPHI01_0352 [Pancytospora philotis]KAI4291104.1 hypothetical protein PAPHI01_0378 [Pancytospora philotis]
MKSLYQELEVPTNASDALLHKQFRVLAYKHTRAHRDEDFGRLNLAYKILSDPYQRSFYDKFGDEYLSALSNSHDSFIYPRLFTSANIAALWLYCFSILLNTAGWFYMSLLFSHYTARNILYIVSPLFLAFFLCNISRTCRSCFKHISFIYYWAAQLIVASCQIGFLSLAVDGLVPYQHALVPAAALEVFIFAYYYWRKDAAQDIPYELYFRYIKGLAVVLFFLPVMSVRFYIPVVLSLLFSAFIYFTWLIPDCLIFVYCFSLDYFTRGGWLFAPALLFLPGLLLVIAGSIFSLYTFKKISKPKSFIHVGCSHLMLEAPEYEV